MTVAMPRQHWIDHPTEHVSQGLATAVEGALWRYDPIRQTNTWIEVSVDGSTVYLDGNIRSAIMKSVATRIASSVAGVEAVVNRLVADPEIERDIAMRMALDPEIEVTTDKVSVTVQAGQVVLGGRVFADSQDEADAMRERIGELAGRAEGLRSLHNAIEAIEGDESAFIVTADVAEDDESAAKVVGPRRGGGLIPDPLKDKLRAMIQARAETRAAKSS